MSSMSLFFLRLFAALWLVLIGIVDVEAADAPENPSAVVVQDQVALRAAPKESAQQQAVLWQGDTLEIRGERQEFLQVYDHRRERGGYVRAAQVRRLSLREQDAPELLSVVRFLRDTPGAEALGMAYVAAYLKAAPGKSIDSEPLFALGTMAERLARRASSRHAKADDSVIAAHLEVAASLGVAIKSFERDGRMQLCYDGEAFRRVLALPAPDEQHALAALAVTRHECVEPNMPPIQRYDFDKWRIDVLAKAPRTNLPDYLKNRLRLRSAGIEASYAYQRARRGEDVHDTVDLALQELAAVNKAELTEEDASAYTDAAVRVGASRWGVEAAPKTAVGLSVALTPGEPGQTCIALVDAKHAVANPLAKRCTYGVVWEASARANAMNTTLVLAVQPLDAWRELWVFQKDGDTWRIDVIPPGTDDPDLGYLEFAGWVPGKPQILAAREIKVDGRFQRSFEVIDLATLAVQKHADAPSSLTVFYKWQDAAWKKQTVAIR